MARKYKIRNLTYCSYLKKFNGCTVTIYREIVPPEIDEEVVLMYEVETDDGRRIEVFPDEIVEVE